MIKSHRGAYEVWTWDRDRKRNVYVSRHKKLKDARAAEAQAKLEHAKPKAASAVTFAGYAPQWLEIHHGEGTRRPRESTRRHNEQQLRAFLTQFGDRPLDGGVTRGEALAWARKHRTNAQVISAMLNDAYDDELCQANPFRNRRAKQSDERRHIAPLTREEVDRLATIALDHWGPEGYGLIARAWVLFGAWVGARPGETFTVQWTDLELANGLVRVHRVKGRRQTERIVLPTAAAGAIRAMPPGQGILFRTVTGRPFDKGHLRYHWDPIRSRFRQSVSDERWLELLGGQDNLDFYVLRHFCASQIVARGGNEYDVAGQLGNTPEVARRTYVHSYVEEQNDRNRRLLEGNVRELRAVKEAG